MVFSSLIFLLYFLPVTLIVYFLLGFSLPLQNLWLFIVSIVFYAWGEPKFVIVMLLSIVFNWIAGMFIGRFRDRNKNIAKIVLALAVIADIGVLTVFKYLAFIVTNINGVLRTDMFNVPKISLPIGVSFFTFQAISYLIDVYRSDAKGQKNIIYMGLYIAFFPQLVAGPIVRYNTIENYINKRKFNLSEVIYGINRFAIGLSKKVLLANNLAVVVDKIYELINTGRGLYDTSVVMAWTAAIGYMLQIYFDFSSYSDMAIGLGHIFGFTFEENFNYPYIAHSIVDIWRRWHISLSTWFKEYLYIPLGGSRVENEDLMVRNTFIVWLATGLWHGASWTFVAWGLYMFVFIVFERIISFDKRNIPSAIKHIYTLLVFLFGWVLFRTENLYLLKETLLDMFMANNNSFCNETSIWILKEYWMVFIPAMIFSTPIVPYLSEKIRGTSSHILKIGSGMVYAILLYAAVALSVSSLVRGGYNPFIYFNF